MTVPDAIYEQSGDYHEFFYAGKERGALHCWLEVYLRPDSVGLFTSDRLRPVDLNLNDARILRDILTEHIARQDRKPA